MAAPPLPAAFGSIGAIIIKQNGDPVSCPNTLNFLGTGATLEDLRNGTMNITVIGGGGATGATGATGPTGATGATGASGSLPNINVVGPNEGFDVGTASVHISCATNDTGPITLDLPASPTQNQRVEVVDYDGNCGSNNITLAAGGGININESTTYVLNVDYSAVTIVYNGPLNGFNQWTIQSVYIPTP